MLDWPIAIARVFYISCTPRRMPTRVIIDVPLHSYLYRYRKFAGIMVVRPREALTFCNGSIGRGEHIGDWRGQHFTATPTESAKFLTRSRWSFSGTIELKIG